METLRTIDRNIAFSVIIKVCFYTVLFISEEQLTILHLEMPTSHRNAFTTPPSEPLEKKPGHLTSEQVKHFFEKGWVIIPDLVEKSALEKVKDGISEQVTELANRLHDAGKIKCKHDDKDLFSRMILIEEEFPGASIILHKSGILPKGAKELWSYPKLLNVCEQLIGEEVAGHPVWNLRVKLPEYEVGVVPWHQDNAYFKDDSLNTMILTAWVPLLDTNEHNGGKSKIK